MFAWLIRMGEGIISARTVSVLQVPHMASFSYNVFYDFYFPIREHGLSAIGAFAALSSPYCIIFAIGLLHVSPLLQPIVILPGKVWIK